MTFVVAATWIAKSGEEGRVRDVIRKMTPLSRAEEGNRHYQAQVASDDPRTFLLYEQYVDEAAYETHKASAHFQELVFGYVLEFLEARHVRTYITVDQPA